MKRSDLISSFTPSTMPAEILEAIFVQREPLAQRITSSVSGAALAGDLEHHLAVGPRGMGKTHLLSLVTYRLLADAALAPKLAIAWLREEEWGVTAVGELYEQILVQLASGADNAPDLRERAQRALDALESSDVDDLATEIEGVMPGVLHGRLLLVIVENLDQLFQDIGTDGQHQLRAFLQNQRNAVLLASTPSLTQSIAVRSGLFFGFFAVHHLDELSIDEARQLLTAIAELRDDDEGRRLVEYLATDEAAQRLAVVEHLAGGHPRLWVLMAECITTERLEEVVGLLMAVLDDLTPYYQAQMKALSAQQRKIVMHLSRAEGAVTVKDLAAAVRIQERSAAKQLGDLVRFGYVRKAELPEGFEVQDKRLSAYELREPLLRHVLEVKEARGRPLRLIVELLRAWYGDQKLQAWRDGDDQLARVYASAALDRAAAPDRDEMGEETAAERAYRAGNAAARAGRYDEALAAYETAITLDPQHVRAHYNRGVTLDDLERHEEALAAYETAITLDPQHVRAHYNRGNTLYDLERYEEALAAYETATTLAPDDSDALFNRAIVQVRHGGDRLPLTDELARAIDAAPDLAYLERNLRWLLEASLGTPPDGQVDLLDTLARACAATDTSSALLAVATNTLRGDHRARSEAWIDALHHALTDADIDGALVDLLGSIRDYRATADGAALLRLPKELRDLATEIIGRPPTG